MKENNKTVAVFGATGNLGAYIALHLKEEGYKVLAIGGRKNDNDFFIKHGIEYYSVDIRKPECFNILPSEKIDVVCHFASTLPSRYEFNSVELFETITIGTLNVLNWMVKIGCKKIIFPQTPSDMANFHNNNSIIPENADRHFPLTGDHAIYTIAKNAAIDLMMHYRATHEIRFFALRFFTIYQYHPNPYHYADFKKRMMPYRYIIKRAMESQPIEIWGNFKKKKEMVYIKDFVRLVRNCVDSNGAGGIYNVGNGWQVSLEEQIKGIIEVFSPNDNPSKILYCPEKPDPLENAFAVEKTFNELNWRPKYSYIDQLLDIKKEMDEEPMADLWGRKEDYE